MTATGFTVRRDATSDGRTRVVLGGELDIGSVELARAQLESAWLDERPVLVDLDELTFMDSTGLRLLIEVAAQARLEDRALSITRGSAPVRRLFEVAGVDAVLPLEPER